MSKKIEYSESQLKEFGLVDINPRIITTREKVLAKCLKCSDIREVRLNDLKIKYKKTGQGYKCQTCSRQECNQDLPVYSQEILSRAGLVDTTERSIRTRENVSVRCHECSTESSIKFGVVFFKIKNNKKARLCKKCTALKIDYTERNRKTRETNLERFGHESAMRCPAVRSKMLKSMVDNDYTSKGEREVRDWIETTFPEYEVSKSYCGGANPCEIDMVIKNPDGSNVLAIEYNGDIFHSEFAGRDSKYHLSKTELVRKQKNTQLIHIFESEWKIYPDRVKAFLSGKLQRGVSVRASKCKIIDIDWNIAKEFCDKYHLQGKPSHSVKSYGLEFEGELLSLMTFSKPHRQKMGSDLNLSRYVIKPGYRIHGGLSRLSKRAFGDIGSFITFVHKRLSNGKSYEKAGYSIIGDIKPDYWYWDVVNNKMVSKQSRQKRLVGTPAGITEKEHAKNDGLFRIWDCGKIKFRYE